jgi:hypothetical protein
MQGLRVQSSDNASIGPGDVPMGEVVSLAKGGEPNKDQLALRHESDAAKACGVMI